MTTPQQAQGSSNKIFSFTPDQGSGDPFQDPTQGVPNYTGGLTSTNLARPLPGYGPDPGGAAKFAAAEHGGQLKNVTMGDAMQQLLLNAVSDPDGITNLQQQLIRGGYLNPKSRTFLPGDVQPGDATFQAYGKLLEKSVRTGKPYLDILDADVSRNAGKNAYEYYVKKFGANGEGVDTPTGPISFSTTHTDIPTGMDARAALFTAAKQLWGRNPTDQEISEFTGVLQAYAQQHPSVSSGTIDSSSGRDKVSTSSGGMDADAVSGLAEQFAQQQGANEQQAAGHSIHEYMSMFESALKGGG